MFSLIIVIISIALIAILAIATMYYGGSVFTQGSVKANASAVVNQMSQIAGAQALYKIENAGAEATVEELQSGNYLSSIPVAPADVAPDENGYTVDQTNDLVELVIGNKQVCDEIQVSAGGEVDAADIGTQAYGCAVSGSGETAILTVQYRY